MRPHHLRVTAFGAFAGTEQVSFDDLEGLFLLHGETGAGKTTLLDAISFALYGRVPGERGTARRLRSDHASPGVATEVELEATIAGRRLRVTRRPEHERQKKSGPGTTREPASVRLAERAPDGDWAVKSSRAGEADLEIADLMGMSSEQFFQVVLLPQGRFAKFLHATAQEKEALLQKLFGTDRFRQVEAWLADRRRSTDKDVDAAEQGVTRLIAQAAQAAGVAGPDSPEILGAPRAWIAGRIAEAGAERDAGAALAVLRKDELDRARAAEAEVSQLADRQRRRRDALGQQRDLSAAVPEIASLPPGPDSLRAAGRGRQAQVGRLEGLRAVARQAEAEGAAARTARARAAELAGELDLAAAEAPRRQAARARAEQARDAASQAAAALPAARAEADQARRVADDAAAFVAEHAKRASCYEAHLSARRRAEDARTAALDVREARIDGMRAELAAEMTDDSPCPVCGSRDHPDPVDAASFPPVSREAEAAAFALASAAAAAADEAGQQVAAVAAVLKDLTRRLTDAGFPDLSADPVALAAAAHAARSDADRLADEAGPLSETAVALTGLQIALDDLDSAIADDRAEHAELTEQRAAALAEAEAAAARAAGHHAALTAQLGQEGDLETAIGAATRLADALLSAAAIADDLAKPDLDVPLDPEAPVSETSAAVKAAQQAHDEANAAHATAESRLGQLADLEPRLDGALQALEPLKDRAGQIKHLADLAEGRGANQYKMTLSSFVLAARLEEVAAAASERLLAMTAGRYSLVHSDAKKGNAKAGLSLLACDAWTGIDRDTATLSGGETFLASLALALGLADVVTAESAGAPMSALFIDEGFGTLDEDTLDEVMTVLDGLRAGGRIVGIVSHVTELRQRIPARIHVRKGRSGSHVEVTS